MKDFTDATLHTMNIGAASLHTVVGIGLASWYFTSKRGGAGTVRTATFTLSANGQACPATAPTEHLLISMLLSLIFFTAIVHVLYTCFKTHYGLMIQNENNYCRWMEYAVSATVLLVTIAFSSGMSDLDTLLLCVVSSVAIMMLGHIVERALHTKDRHIASVATAIGWLLLVGVLGIILRTFVSTVQSREKVSPELYSVIVLLCVFYCSFGMVQILQLCGKMTEYHNIEGTYIILSFVSKTMLSLLVGSGIIARANV
jgi:hypothetical protein